MMTAATAPVKSDFRMITLDSLHESPRNPRKHFDKAKLEELSRSIEVSGVITPLLVRPRKEGVGYELAAGHRRRRAAMLVAQRTEQIIDLPCVVREMTDAEFMEALVVENGQREDVHPLEEAQGYFELMKEEIGYDVGKIADRVGRSKDFVYDRLKLLSLTPKAQELFLENRFTLAHAIILARLSPEWQERAIAIDDENMYDFHRTPSGLFTRDNARLALDTEDDESGNPYDECKPVSVREFQSWVDTSVRFDTEAADVQDLFPETADALVTAEEAELKVIHITHLYQTPADARDDGQRTYTQRAWERADGKFDSKECEHAVLGVVVVGPGRGESFPVCIAKEKCAVHYGDRIREKAQREKAASKNGASSATAKADAAAERERGREERQREADELARRRWTKAEKAIAEAIADKVRAAPLNVLADVLVERTRISKRAATILPRGRTADDLLRYLAFGELEGDLTPWHGPTVVKRLGLDLKKLLDEHAPIEKAKAAK